MLILDLLYALILLGTFPFWAKYVFKSKYRRLLKQRMQPQLPAAAEPAVWLHAVSVGEVRSLKSLIRGLEEKKYPVVLSVTTPSGFEFARREYPGLRVILSPLDLSFIVRRFVNRINPKLVVFNELEVWPNWITLLHRQDIPMLLINGRISAAAFSRYRFFSFFLWRFFRHIDCFLVQNTIYRKRFLQLRIPDEKIVICGNIKADEADLGQRQLPARQEVLAHLGLGPLSRKILTLASSHPGSENIVLAAIGPLSADYLFIIVPRHVQRAQAIARRLERLGLSCAIFSRRQPVPSSIQVLIYDQLGYLPPIMSISDIVFMGGTHDAKIGGHNLYEPAAMGKLILGGPHYGNFPDIGSELEATGVYRQINSSQELLDFAARFHDIDMARIAAMARKAVAQRKGSLACTLEQIQRFAG